MAATPRLLPMHSLEPELRQLHIAGALDNTAANHAIALESGAAFSLFHELRIAMYAAVALIIGGLCLVLKDNFDRIGPLAIIALIALIAATCYAYVIRTQLQSQPRSLLGDYILLLGALLISADVAFAETQFHLFGDHWSWYLLLLAFIHAVTAYRLDSRLVLSVALASLAGWFGVEQRLGDWFDAYHSSWLAGGRMLACGAVVFGWRMANERAHKRLHFNEVLEHYAANLGFWGGLAWCAIDGWLALGALIVAALAVIVVRRGLRVVSEMLVAYGVVYSAIGICIFTGKLMGGVLLTSFVVLLAVIGVAILLWRLHAQMRTMKS